MQHCVADDAGISNLDLLTQLQTQVRVGYLSGDESPQVPVLADGNSSIGIIERRGFDLRRVEELEAITSGQALVEHMARIRERLAELGLGIE